MKWVRFVFCVLNVTIDRNTLLQLMKEVQSVKRFWMKQVKGINCWLSGIPSCRSAFRNWATRFQARSTMLRTTEFRNKDAEHGSCAYRGTSCKVPPRCYSKTCSCFGDHILPCGIALIWPIRPPPQTPRETKPTTRRMPSGWRVSKNNVISTARWLYPKFQNVLTL